MNHLVKQNWLQTAIDIRKFHINQLKLENGWTIEKTALALNRSVGSISQYILIAEWSRTHEVQLKRCNSMNEGLEFIKRKKKEMELET